MTITLYFYKLNDFWQELLIKAHMFETLDSGMLRETNSFDGLSNEELQILRLLMTRFESPSTTTTPHFVH